MKSFNPVVWAIALVILFLFGAASYRIFHECETSSLKLRDWLEVSLGGNCPRDTESSIDGVSKAPQILPIRAATVPLDALKRNTGDDVGAERIADPGKHKAGDLSYGPYWPIEKFGGPGKYFVEYEVFVDQSSGSGPTVGKIFLDVNTRDLKQGISLAEQQLFPADWKQTGYKTITLVLDVPQDYANWLMQMRMQWDGGYITKLRPINVLRVK